MFSHNHNTCNCPFLLTFQETLPHKMIGRICHHPESFPTMRKVSRPSGKFPDHPESFQIIQKFPNHLESFQIIRKVSKPSGKFPDHPESFKIIRKVSRLSRNMCILACFLMMDFIGMCKNFPGGNAAMRHGFLCLCISWCLISNVRCKTLIGAEYHQCGSMLYIGAKFQ